MLKEWWDNRPIIAKIVLGAIALALFAVLVKLTGDFAYQLGRMLARIL